MRLAERLGLLREAHLLQVVDRAGAVRSPEEASALHPAPGGGVDRERRAMHGLSGCTDEVWAASTDVLQELQDGAGKVKLVHKLTARMGDPWHSMEQASSLLAHAWRSAPELADILTRGPAAHMLRNA